MRALVLGATGRIGNAVVRELLARGAEVTATSRRAEPAENLRDLKVDYRSGDADRPGQLAEWVRGHSVVVDAAAPYALWLDVPAPAAERRLDELLRAIADHGAALVFVGSFISNPRERTLLGRTRAQLLRRLHPYIERKERMDARIRAAIREGLPIVLLRPTFCIGPWDISDPTVAFIPMLMNGTLPAVTNHEMNVIDVRDVAAMVSASLERGRFGHCIPVAGHNATVESFADLVCRTARVPGPSWRVPPALAAAAAYANEWLQWSGVERPSVGPLLLLEQIWAQPGREQRDLGVGLRPLSLSVLDAVDWYNRPPAPSP